MAMTLLPNRLHGLSSKTMKVQRMGFSNVPTRNSKLRISTCCSTTPGIPQRYAVLGAGFAGISVAWHLLQHCSKTSPTCIEIYDEVGIGGGASGVSGGLLHPYSPKGKLLWNGAECWEEALKLLTVAEAIIAELASGEICSENKQHTVAETIAWRRGIFRIAATAKNVYDMKKCAQVSLSDCKISCINSIAAKELLPELVLPSDFALYMPQAVNIHPERYLKALFMACQRKARDLSASGSSGTRVSLHKRNIGSLLEFSAF